MNYFGLFFTFMIPGILMGIMFASVLRESIQRQRRAMRRKKRQAENRPTHGKLYVYDMSEDAKSAA